MRTITVKVFDDADAEEVFEVIVDAAAGAGLMVEVEADDD